MKRFAVAVLLVAMLAAIASPAFAGVQVERRGDENPMAVIAKATGWGMLTGMLLGMAVGLAANTESDAPLRWGIAVGTFGGLAVGIQHVRHRVEPNALLELGGDRPGSGGLAAIEAVPDGARVRAIALRF